MIWSACSGQNHIKPISGKAYRMVESQEHVATLGYVDTLDEQAILEALLDESKPPYPTGIPDDLHYRLKTPFRYPPLLWGSRFGGTYEPSLFYAGTSLQAALTESAYYRLVFLLSMDSPGPKSLLRSEHTVFSVPYACDRGVQLQKPPFNQYQSALTNKIDYKETQQLGGELRKAGLAAFEYRSARTKDALDCMAMFDGTAFAEKKPSTMNQWLCETRASGVMLKAAGRTEVYHFPIKDFLLKGEFPFQG